MTPNQRTMKSREVATFVQGRFGFDAAAYIWWRQYEGLPPASPKQLYKAAYMHHRHTLALFEERLRKYVR
jgi:hypothetical protein